MANTIPELTLFFYVKNTSSVPNNLQLNKELQYNADRIGDQQNKITFKSTLKDVTDILNSPTQITYPGSLFKKTVTSDDSIYTLSGEDDIPVLIYDSTLFDEELRKSGIAIKSSDLNLVTNKDANIIFIINILMVAYYFPSYVINNFEKVLNDPDYIFHGFLDDTEYDNKYVNTSSSIIEDTNNSSIKNLSFNINMKNEHDSNNNVVGDFELKINAYFNPDVFIDFYKKDKFSVYLYEDDVEAPNDVNSVTYNVNPTEFENKIMKKLFNSLNINRYKTLDSFITAKHINTNNDAIIINEKFWIFTMYSNTHESGLPDSPTLEQIRSTVRQYLKEESTTHKNQEDLYYIERWPELFSNANIIISPSYIDTPHIITPTIISNKVNEIKVNHSHISNDKIEIFYIGKSSSDPTSIFSGPIFAFDANTDGTLSNPISGLFPNYDLNIEQTTSEGDQNEFKKLLIELIKCSSGIITNFLNIQNDLRSKHFISVDGTDNDWYIKFTFKSRNFMLRSKRDVSLPDNNNPTSNS